MRSLWPGTDRDATRGNGGIYPTYLCNWLHHEGLATKDCLSFRCDVLDPVIAEELLKALQPAELELALVALQELETRDQAIMRQWQMRLERAEYETALAERRYQEVDPSNRLVAGTLERRWNDALVQLQDLKKQAGEFQRQEARVATPEQKEKVLALARDLPRLWHAPTTQAKDRKRMLRLLIKDITVEKPPAQATLGSHPLAGRGLDQLLRTASAQHRRPRALSCRSGGPSPGTGAALDSMRRSLISSIEKGMPAPKASRITGRLSRWIRWRYQIPPAKLKKPEELTVQQVAQQFGVNPDVVYYWIEHRIIRARRLNTMPYWITVSDTDQQKLRDWVRNSAKIQKAS